MKCTDIQDLLIETDDLSTLEGRKEFVGHLASCTACQASYRQEQSLKSVFRKLGEAPPPHDLEKRVLAIFQPPATAQLSPRGGVCPEKAMDGACVSGPSSSWFGIPLRFGLSFALVFLVAVGLLQWQPPSDRGKIEDERAASQQLAFAPPLGKTNPSLEGAGSRQAAAAIAPEGMSQNGEERASGGNESSDAAKPSAAPVAQPIVVARASPPPAPAWDKAPPPPLLLAAAPQEPFSMHEKGKAESKATGNKVAAPLLAPADADIPEKHHDGMRLESNSLDGAQMARADAPNAGANAFAEEKVSEMAPEGEVFLMVDSQKMKEDRDSGGVGGGDSQEREKKRILPRLAKAPSSRLKDLNMSAFQDSPQASGIVSGKNESHKTITGPMVLRRENEPMNRVSQKTTTGPMALGLEDEPKNHVATRTPQDRIEALLRQHSSEIADGPVSLDEWLRKGWINVSEVAALRPPQGKTWFVKRQEGRWSAALR